MKKTIQIVIALLISINAWSQAPEKMSYQAVIRDADNKLVVNQSVGMQVSVLKGGQSGTAVYVERQTPTTNANGLLSLEIGTGNVSTGVFSNIDWGSDTYFIKTETDITGGTNYTITGTSQMMSVPYALHSKSTESLNGTVVLSKYTSAEQNALTPSEGMIIFNTDSKKYRGYSSGSVVDIDQNERNNCNGGIGQSFTADSTGKLTAIQVNGCGGAGILTLKIYDGEGMGGTLLHSQTVNLASPTTYTFTLSTPVEMTQGQVYTFDFDGAGYTAWNSNQNPYSGGQGYVNDTPSGSMDWMFKTFIDNSGWIDLN